MALDGSGRGGGAAAGGDGPAPDKEFARGRRGAPPARTSKTGRGKTNEDDNNPSKRRTSLRITTGRKGRGAELTQRRGSLRKRDRSSQREAKLDAALVRRTVVLPEYVVVVVVVVLGGVVGNLGTSHCLIVFPIQFSSLAVAP